MTENKIKLTKRESEIMTLISMGLLNKEISQRLKISVRTTEAYIRKIYIKIRAQNRSNAVAIFIKNNLSMEKQIIRDI